MTDKAGPAEQDLTDLLAALRLLRELEAAIQERLKLTTDDDARGQAQACAEMLPEIEAELSDAILALGKVKGQGSRGRRRLRGGAACQTRERPPA